MVMAYAICILYLENLFRNAANFEEAGISSILRQSAEFLIRHHTEEVPVVFAPRVRKINRTQIVSVGEGCSNINAVRKIEHFGSP